VTGKDLGYAGPAPADSPPASARRRPLWRELAFLLLVAAGLTVIIKTSENAVIGRGFLVAWPPAQLKELPIPATFAQPALAVPHRRGPANPPMAVGLAGMPPLAWACRRQSAHVTTDRR
jgi:hypothetical protein